MAVTVIVFLEAYVRRDRNPVRDDSYEVELKNIKNDDNNESSDKKEEEEAAEVRDLEQVAGVEANTSNIWILEDYVEESLEVVESS